MPEPYVGEIRMFAGNFPPNGWLFCEGQTLPIAENEVLFQLIGTTYGGDGEQTFNVPNLAGRAPIHQGIQPSGPTYQMGEMAGTENVTLTTQQIPIHNHALLASTAVAQQTIPTANVVAQAATGFLYIQEVPDATFANNAIGPVGGSQPHENMQPYLCINYIISLFGVFPSQT